MEQGDKLCDARLGEKLRAASKKAMYVLILGIIFAVIAGISLLQGWWAASAIFSVTALVCCLIWARNKSKIRMLVSDHVTLDALENSFELIEYRRKDHIDEGRLREARIRFDWDKSLGGDYFEARYRDVDLTFSDVRLIREQISIDKNGNVTKQDIPVFTGQWLIVGLNREINPPVVVSERNRSLLRGYEKTRSGVQTENVRFNEKFLILTDDAHTAFYVLTPHFMEFIMSAKEVADGQKHLCFTGGHVHIAINSGRDSFEPCRDIKNVPALRARIQSEVDYIKAVIDEFLLNERLFSPRD